MTTGRVRGRRAIRLLLAGALRLELPVVALWVAAGLGLAAITSHMYDWFVMTDELLYERLAISVAHLHSPLPHVHGDLIPNVSQLYPLLLALVFRHGLVPSSLHAAHALNAWVMTSAAIPAFLLARTVTQRRWAAYLVALFTVTVPWMVFASFLLTEVAAYPAFLWAMLALQHAVASPRARNDVLALGGIALATLARTQFFLLIVVLALAVLVYELSLRRAVTRHRVLAAVCALIALAAIVLTAAGRFSSTFGTYSQAVEGNPFPAHFAPFLAEHLTTIAFSLGVLPFVIGIAWLLTGFGDMSAGRRAFAVLATLTIAALAIEVTSFDSRFGGGVVRERYLFYVAPLVFVGFAGALADRRWPRWSLLVPCALLVYGFSQASLPTYPKLNADTPAAALDDELVKLAHSRHVAHFVLIGGTLVLTALFLEAAHLLRHSYVAAMLALLTALLLPAETGHAFARLYSGNGTAGRPLTVDQGVVFDWVDRTIGTRAHVAMVPFPLLYGDYWAGVGYWWDLEFWNESVDRTVGLPGEFQWTPSTFPKVDLRFNQRTGAANASPAPYVIEANKETRFRISGASVATFHDTRDTLFIHADMPWRTNWLTYGLYDDGWTRPGVTARIRIFASPKQTTTLVRTLTLGVQAPAPINARPFTVSSGLARVAGTATQGDRVIVRMPVCVPAHGYGVVRLRTSAASTTYGDPRNSIAGAIPRQVGVHLTEIAVADELGKPC